MVKKIILITLASVVLYYGGKFYLIMRWGNMISECGDYSVVSEMQKDKAPTAEKLKYSAKVWACVKEKQTFIDAMFFKIPEGWLNPPSTQRVGPQNEK